MHDKKPIREGIWM